MNDQTILKYLAMSGNREMHDYLEKRLSAGGSSPASGSETNGTRTEPDAHDKPTAQLGHSRTKDGVKFKRLSEYLRHEAWKHEEYGKDFANNDDPIAAEAHQNHAEAFREWDEIISAILEAEPLTQSGAGEDERCPDCNGQGHHAYMSSEGPDIDVCHLCEGSGSRRERSGSGND